MSVNFISTASLNQSTERNINKVVNERDNIGRQVQTGKKFENIYDASASEASDIVNIQESIDVQKKDAEILQKGFRRVDEMSDELRSMTKYLQGMLKDWQISTNAITSNDFTPQKQEEFAKVLLSGMGNFLNKKSIYDGTYLFAGENMDTKPVELSGNVDADKYYLGSKRNMSFSYGDAQIKLDFNAGDSSIREIVKLFADVKTNGADNVQEVFVQFKVGIDKLIEAKQRVDSVSKDLKQFEGMQRTSIENSTKSYSDIVNVHEVTGYTELMQVSKRLSEIYSSIGALSKSLVDYIRL
jgi:flagellin-like hook-associated protein FlgL